MKSCFANELISCINEGPGSIYFPYAMLHCKWHLLHVCVCSLLISSIHISHCVAVCVSLPIKDIYLHSPDVRWEDIIGLEDAKRLVKEAVVYPIKVTADARTCWYFSTGCPSSILNTSSLKGLKRRRAVGSGQSVRLTLNLYQGYYGNTHTHTYRWIDRWRGRSAHADGMPCGIYIHSHIHTICLCI